MCTPTNAAKEARLKDALIRKLIKTKKGNRRKALNLQSNQGSRFILTTNHQCPNISFTIDFTSDVSYSSATDDDPDETRISLNLSDSIHDDTLKVPSRLSLTEGSISSLLCSPVPLNTVFARRQLLSQLGFSSALQTLFEEISFAERIANKILYWVGDRFIRVFANHHDNQSITQSFKESLLHLAGCSSNSNISFESNRPSNSDARRECSSAVLVSDMDCILVRECQFLSNPDVSSDRKYPTETENSSIFYFDEVNENLAPKPTGNVSLQPEESEYKSIEKKIDTVTIPREVDEGIKSSNFSPYENTTSCSIHLYSDLMTISRDSHVDYWSHTTCCDNISEKKQETCCDNNIVEKKEETCPDNIAEKGCYLDEVTKVRSTKVNISPLSGTIESESEVLDTKDARESSTGSTVSNF